MSTCPQKIPVGSTEAPITRENNFEPPPVSCIATPCYTTASMSAEKDLRDEAYIDMLKLMINPGVHQNQTAFYTRTNSKLYKILSALTFSRWFCRQGAAKQQDIMDRRRFVFEFMIGWLVRWYNKNALVFPMLCLSLLALRCHLSTMFWNALLHLRLLYSKDFTQRLALDMGDRLQLLDLQRSKNRECDRVAIATFDNCLLRFDTSYEGVSHDERDGNSQYMLINWNYMLIGNQHTCTEEYDYNSSSWWVPITHEAVVAWLLDSDPLKELINEDWSNGLKFLQNENGYPINVLNHPDYNPPYGRSIVSYQNHIRTLHGTAGYDDVRKGLAAIVSLLCVTMCVSWILVVGDQQSYSRMVWLIRHESPTYDAIIPLPGDFHFAVHLLMAIHMLWWDHLVSFVIRKSGFGLQTIHEHWDQVSLYNRYRNFYETLLWQFLLMSLK